MATGTGLAPFMSMIDTLRGRGQQRDIVLLHGVSYDHDLAWRGELQDLADGGELSAPLRGHGLAPAGLPDWTGLHRPRRGVIEEQLDEHGLTPENTTLYLCGNPEMVSAVEEIATARGFAARAGPQGAVLAEGPDALRRPMDDRFYLTTAIFYPSPAPPLHSLFEAIGADAIARYQRLPWARRPGS